MKSLIKKLIPKGSLRAYHKGLAVAGAFRYRFPSRRLKVIGVTGTNGKSTVVALATRILEEAGYKTASLSSIRFKIGEREWANTLKMTMPGRFKLQKFLHEAREAGCEYAVIEVTSEGIAQLRHWGIHFDVAVITNVTPEHIESHGTFEGYRQAKGKLFRALGKGKRKRLPKGSEHLKTVSVVNLDDENADYFLLFHADITYGYTLEGRFRESSHTMTVVKPEDFSVGENGIRFSFRGKDFTMRLHGLFNLSNVLAALSVGLSQGITEETMERALRGIDVVPGRFEIVTKKPFIVIVDYAHTPDALERVYTAAANLKTDPGGQTICVLGAAGGGRDKWKRPEFGRLAARYCTNIILTNEDPYDEDPKKIITSIKEGLEKADYSMNNLVTLIDRKEAIREALSRAHEGDLVVITGKGCEPWMMVEDGKRIPWDDRKIVRDELSHIIKE